MFYRLTQRLFRRIFPEKIQDLSAVEKDHGNLCICPTAKVNIPCVHLKENCSFIVGDHSIVEGNVYFERSHASVSIGDRTFIGASSIFCATEIKIGNDVLISFGAAIADHDSHSIIFEHRKQDVVNWYDGKKDWTHVKSRPVMISDKVWIGMHAILLEGVTIGEGAVVGAGSVITKDVPAYVVVAGNPARVVRRIEAVR